MRKLRHRADLENALYQAMIGTIEKRETDRIYLGNGHHLTQELVKLSADVLINKWGLFNEAETAEPAIVRGDVPSDSPER